MEVPPQLPAVQVSLNVQALPSLQVPPVMFWSTHLPVLVLQVLAWHGFVGCGQFTWMEKLLSFGTSCASPQLASPFTLFTQTVKPKLPQAPLTGVYVNGKLKLEPDSSSG